LCIAEKYIVSRHLPPYCLHFTQKSISVMQKVHLVMNRSKTDDTALVQLIDKKMIYINSIRIIYICFNNQYNYKSANINVGNILKTYNAHE
jgi:hypothetical protein